MNEDRRLQKDTVVHLGDVGVDIAHFFTFSRVQYLCRVHAMLSDSMY